MGLRWGNVLGLVMLLPALFSSEVVHLNVWHESTFLMAVAVAYMNTALWLVNEC